MRLPRLRLICRALQSKQNRREALPIAESTQVRRIGRAQRRRPAPKTPGAGKGDHKERRAACPGPRMQAVHGDR